MKKLMAVLLLVACSAEKPAPPKETLKPPSPAEAKEMLASSGDFSEFEFTNAAFTLPLKRSAMNEPARAIAADLEKAGFIGFTGEDVALPTKTLNDRRFIPRPNGYMDIVPLARKEITEVTAVRPTSEGLDIDFNWHWLPNEIGSAITSGPIRDRFDSPHTATATLIPSGKEWMILRIRTKS